VCRGLSHSLALLGGRPSVRCKVWWRRARSHRGLCGAVLAWEGASGGARAVWLACVCSCVCLWRVPHARGATGAEVTAQALSADNETRAFHYLLRPADVSLCAQLLPWVLRHTRPCMACVRTWLLPCAHPPALVWPVYARGRCLAHTPLPLYGLCTSTRRAAPRKGPLH